MSNWNLVTRFSCNTRLSGLTAYNYDHKWTFTQLPLIIIGTQPSQNHCTIKSITNLISWTSHKISSWYYQRHLIVQSFQRGMPDYFRDDIGITCQANDLIRWSKKAYKMGSFFKPAQSFCWECLRKWIICKWSFALLSCNAAWHNRLILNALTVLAWWVINKYIQVTPVIFFRQNTKHGAFETFPEHKIMAYSAKKSFLL